MASSDPSFIENLINSRNRDISLFFPFILGLNPSNQSENHESPDRIVLINPFTQGMVVIERSVGGGDSGSGERFASFFDDLFSRKGGHPPASRASIEAMESVEIGEGEDDDHQCVICLDECGIGEKVKEMPCKHRFHGECIEKWLNIHGSCPVCRYEMPVDDDDDDGEKRRESGGERRREIWVSFTFSSERRRGENDENVSSERE